jgi:hypothetical protein
MPIARKVILVLLLAALTYSLYSVYITRSSPFVVNKWAAFKSTLQAFPYVTDGNLNLYYFDTETVIPTQIKVKWGSGAVGYGLSDPLASKDFKFTAYIEDITQKLIILSNETLRGYEVPVACKVDYINAWTPDNKVIFYCPEDDIDTRKEDMTPWKGKETFSKKYVGGFYVFDITKGTLLNLYPLNYIERVLDNDTVLVRSGYDQQRLLAFNINSFTADYDRITDLFAFDVSQFNVSQDVSHWAFISGDILTYKTGSIVYAPFPKKTGVIVDTGKWAEAQWPTISPNNNLLAYVKTISMKDGIPINMIKLYNIGNKSTVDLTSGEIVTWFDNTKLIFYRTVLINGKFQKEFYYYNIPQRTEKKISG